jgi:hypothetical protein
MAQQVPEPIQILEALSTSLDKHDEYIPHHEQQGFAFKVAEKLNSLAEDLIKGSESFIAPDRKKHFELNVTVALARCIEGLINDALERSHEVQNIKNIWLGLRSKAETTARRLEFQSPTSASHFRATLWWMSERGVEEDLDLVREIKDNPPFTDDDLLQLLETTDEKISQRVDDPFYVLKKGDEAYQRNRRLWDQIYQGKYIAIYKNDVILASEDETELTAEIIRMQKDKGPFRAYIVKPGDSIIDVASPRKRELKKPEDSGGENDSASAADIQRIGWNTFRERLPKLLEEVPGKWVAFHGRKDVALESTMRELYEKLMRDQIPLDEVIVCKVEPLSPPINLRTFLKSRVG